MFDPDLKYTHNPAYKYVLFKIPEILRQTSVSPELCALTCEMIEQLQLPSKLRNI
jgi:hypothetical protein